ncbi:MAG: DNA adenine methylase [Kiritimatiellae bacterium]|jgi:DNA adenine methylase|nr:DNA adenine methylase [Kiritimatiellia bacterium]
MKLKRLSPLRYPGGKAKILDFIIKVIEENNCLNSPYVEPYAGGAGVALGLLLGGYVSRIHINDIDQAIFSFWKSIITETDEFIQKVHDTPVTISEWNKQKDIYKNLCDYTELERGFSAFFLNRCNRSGILTGGCIGGKEQKSKYKLDARFNKNNLIKRIERIATYKDKIELYNQDTLALLQENKNEFKNAIIYLDPPYYEKGFCLYKNFYKHDDHVRIADILSQLSGHWIVSYDNVPEIMDIYSGVVNREFNISYSIGQNRKGKEIMFFSPKLKVPNISIY